MAIYFKYSSVYMPTPTSQSMLNPLLFPKGNREFLLCLQVHFCFVSKFIYIIFFKDPAYKGYHMFVFL